MAQKLRKIMTSAPVALRPSQPLTDAGRARCASRGRVRPCGRPVGVLSLGDLAIERDERSAPADISAKAPNT